MSTSTFLLLVFISQSSGPTFLEQGLTSAHEKIAKDPKHAEGYNDLAMALTRKERETGSPAFLVQAEVAVAKSLKLEPANFEGRRARVALRLRQRRYYDALEEALALNKQTPDDNQMYGFISEAQLALGNYLAAETAVQRMMDLRQVNGPGMERGATLREMIGFPDGAIDWWNQSLQLASDRDTEERAFIQVQTARVYREEGKYDAATQYAQQAMALCQGYPAALTELGRISLESGHPKEAAGFWRARLKISADMESVYWLGQALSASGEKDDATATLLDFEKQARAAADSPANANALLIRYLADNGHAAEAITLAAKAVKKQRDVFTLSAYSWALFKNGQSADALEQVKKALAPGLRDADLYYQAGLISQKAGQKEDAAKYFRTAFEVNSNSPRLKEILNQLALLSPPSAD